MDWQVVALGSYDDSFSCLRKFNTKARIFSRGGLYSLISLPGWTKTNI
jgi:hypothetical protein